MKFKYWPLIFVISILVLISMSSCEDQRVSEPYADFKENYSEYYDLTFVSMIYYLRATASFPKEFSDLYSIASDSLRSDLEAFQRLYNPKFLLDERAQVLKCYIPGPDLKDDRLKKEIVSDFENWDSVMDLQGDIVYGLFNKPPSCSYVDFYFATCENGRVTNEYTRPSEILGLRKIFPQTYDLDDKFVFWMVKTEKGIRSRTICGNKDSIFSNEEEISKFLDESDFVLGDSTLFYLGE